jgi:tRNA A-37 threonylcarbamoyl transferase component Bud32/WD40 repeat protein
MPLAFGTRLGPYEILAPLGAGGMGEVYRAKDTRVDRAVALKVLPEELFESEERRQRFEREARILASLNHPGIAALYSFEEIPSSTSSASRHILVMELLEGETLRESLRGGPLPPRRALDVALQVANGLAAAHEKGIVHRDLKPENVFITKDGRVKVLDFGLSKLTRLAEGSAGLTATPTQSLLTEAGAVFGTASYMSPEQVRGEPLDHRSDVFAFGTILHEMVSGKNPFRKETAVETMTAILKEEPPPPEPSPLSLIAARCLEKRRERRFQSTEDLAFALDSISKGPASGGLAQLPSTSVAKRPPRIRWIAFPAAAALLLTGAWLLWKRSEVLPPMTFERLTFRRGVVWSARFAPDGQTVVFGAAWEGKPVELFETRVGSTESRSLGFESGNIAAVSHAGEMALVLRPRFLTSFNHPGTLARASLAGGAARELLADVHAADWSPDGADLAVAHGSKGKSLLEFPPGKVIHEAEGVLGDLRFSPDGRQIAFWEYAPSGPRIVVVSRDGSGRRVLSDGWRIASFGLAWSPSGREIWFSAIGDEARSADATARAVYAVDLSGRVRLVSRMPGSLVLFDVARDGRVLMTHSAEGPGLVAHAPGASAELDLSWLAVSFLGDLSRDGRIVVFTDGRGGLYLRKTDGSAAVRLGSGFALGPMAISPDGAWVAAAMLGSPFRMTLVPTGAGASRELALEGLDAVSAVLWAHDSRSMFLLGSQKGHGARLYGQSLSEPVLRPITGEILSPFQGADGLVLSPDGRSLALMSDGTVRLFSIDGTALRTVPGAFSGHMLIGWTSDGRALHSNRLTDLPGRIYRLDLATGEAKVLREMLPADPAGIWRIHPIRITPDGSSYAYTYTRRVGALYVFDGLK